MNRFATFILIYFSQCLQGFYEIGKKLLKINLQVGENLIVFLQVMKSLLTLNIFRIGLPSFQVGKVEKRGSLLVVALKQGGDVFLIMNHEYILA